MCFVAYEKEVAQKKKVRHPFTFGKKMFFEGKNARFKLSGFRVYIRILHFRAHGGPPGAFRGGLCGTTTPAAHVERNTPSESCCASRNRRRIPKLCKTASLQNDNEGLRSLAVFEESSC